MTFNILSVKIHDKNIFFLGNFSNSLKFFFYFYFKIITHEKYILLHIIGIYFLFKYKV